MCQLACLLQPRLKPIVLPALYRGLWTSASELVHTISHTYYMLLKNDSLHVL
jgi:hypothetical protein